MQNKVIFMALLTIFENACLPGESQDFKTWSIPEKPCTVPYSISRRPSVSAYGEVSNSGEGPPVYWFLKRPNSERNVAVIEVKKTCPVILNPPGFDYGPIPELKNLSKNTAEKLWGKAISSKEEPQTSLFQLHAESNFEFFCYAKFIGGKLSQYKIVGKALRGESQWISVN